MKFTPAYPDQICIGHQTKCKFCGKEITVYIDKDYADLSDPYGIIQLAACNQCADYKTREMHIRDRLHRICSVLAQKKNKLSDDQRSGFRQGLTNATRAYVGLISEWKNREVVWDDNCIDAMMQVSSEWPTIIKRLLLLQHRQPNHEHDQ
jgi:hypothetical protein